MDNMISLIGTAVHMGPQIVLYDVGRYLIAAGAMFLILLIVRKTPWRTRKIQARHAKMGDYRREILASIRTGLIFALSGIGIAWGASNGVFKVCDGRLESLGSAAATLILLLVVHDAYFYWTHRAMHHPRLFRWFHRTHHRSVTPTPFAAYAFDMPEAVVQAAFVPLWLLVVPTHPTVLFAFLTVMIVRNVWGHCGYELHPRGMADHPLWGLLTTTTHHDLHHAGSFGHNFGLYFTWWDRLMGTEHPDYRPRFQQVTAQ